MRYIFALLIFLSACQPLPTPQAQDRIVIANRGNIDGGHSLIVTPDDRVVYDAYGRDMAPQTQGWQWQDATGMTGQASIQSPGAYRRALALLRAAARADSPASSAPSFARCTTAGETSILLVSPSEQLFARQAAACLAAAPAGSIQAQHLQAVTALALSLRRAILPDGWLQR